MFDNIHVHRGSTKYVPYEKNVTITENRAPTDESVALLNEFQEKAKQNLFKSIQVETNYVKAIAFYFKGEMVDDRMHYGIKFNVNGKDYRLDGHVDGWDFRKDVKNAYAGFGDLGIFKAFHTYLSEIIALELMSQDKDFQETLKNHK